MKSSAFSYGCRDPCLTIKVTNHEKGIATSRHRSALQVSILVAGISTVAAPPVAEILFPQEPIKGWVFLSGLAAAQYAASSLILRSRSLSAPRAGFVVTASLFMTLASSAFALIVAMFSGLTFVAIKPAPQVDTIRCSCRDDSNSKRIEISIREENDERK